MFFSVRVELQFLLNVAHFFFKLLVNRSILDFVLDPGKRVTIESKREYACTRIRMNDEQLTDHLQLKGQMKFISFSELTCYYSKTACYHSSACYSVHRELTQNTMATRTSSNKRFNKQNNSCARAL